MPKCVESGCDGYGFWYQDNEGNICTSREGIKTTCLICNGSGKTPTNVEETTMEIIGHLVDADRADIENNKDALGNHLALAFIKLFEFYPDYDTYVLRSYFPKYSMRKIIYAVVAGHYYEAINRVGNYFISNNIDLEKHVLTQLEYNII